MKKRIEQLLNGKFIYEQPELLFSQDRIFATLKAGETTKDEIYFGTDDNRRISGFVTSSDRRLVPGFDRFSGTTVRMPYGVDAEREWGGRERALKAGCVLLPVSENISCRLLYRYRRKR